MGKYSEMCDRRYDGLLKDCEMYFPYVVEKMVTWYPSGSDEIVIRTNDGMTYVYYGMSHSCGVLHDPSDEDLDSMEENQWRESFSFKLRKRMETTSLNQEKLSERTGISTHTISKYMRGKATPSTYNLCKIARALKCSETELIGFSGIGRIR